MTQITAVEFQRKFGTFQHQAAREPVEITRHGRREWVLMSADHYDWLTAAARRTFCTAEAADLVVAAVRGAEMDHEHAHLGLDDAPSWVVVSEHNVDEWRIGAVAGAPGGLHTSGPNH